MVDFRKLRASQVHQPVTDPIEIFRRLPKPPGITDLYTSQAEVLKSWYERQDERDLVVKLHTGGGKTLVGLLIAQSILNNTHEPVVYLSPTAQLVKQIIGKAKEYSIPAVAYDKDKWGEFPEDFLNAKSVLICTYQALFNGRSRFGVRGSVKEIFRAAGIILDDAHTAFSTMRDSFTLRVTKAQDLDGYKHLTTLFRADFDEISKVGTFDDIVTGDSLGILEVPYWSWKAKSGQVREYIQSKSGAEDYGWVWPFLRDAFDYCHCLISRNSFVITPVFPMVDLIPTFAECPHRIFMSATIGDDSAIVRTFDANPDSIGKPITSNSLAGVSERMILVPELMKLPAPEIPQILRKLAAELADVEGVGTVILTPTNSSAEHWQDIATMANTSEMVSTSIKELQNGESCGPFVFANRYDGIDLPGDACRLLIMWRSPQGVSEYDLYRAEVFGDSSAVNSELAQRIEQGIGRGARGAGDYCVVIMAGRDLVARISRSSNQKMLTNSTRAQLEIGLNVSRDVSNEQMLKDTIMSCLNRDIDWIEYHAETLATLTEPDPIDIDLLKLAAIERKAFTLMRDNYFEKAITRLTKYTDNMSDQKSRGWLLQLASRIAHYWGKTDLAQQLQQQAYANNTNLLRPQVAPAYVALPTPSEQAEEIVAKIDKYIPRRGFLAEFDRLTAYLIPTASANQFEQALADLGSMLGFHTQRPEKTYGIGPDVLWLLDMNVGLVIEAKSRKYPKNPLTKENHGQLLNAEQWFREEYPSLQCIRVSMHPTGIATKSVSAGETTALTLAKLSELIVESRRLFEVLCNSAVSRDELVLRCQQLLADSSLQSQSLIKHYLMPLEKEP